MPTPMLIPVPSDTEPEEVSEYHEVSDAFLSLADLASDCERQWIVEGVLELNDIAIIGAPEKSGKSWMLLDLAVATVIGGKWLHQFDVAIRGRVILMETENGSRAVIARIMRLARAHGADPIEVLRAIGYVRRRACLDDADLCYLTRDFSRAAQRVGEPALVVIDPLRGHLAGNEDVAHDIEQAMNGARAIRNACNAPVVIAHHLNKGGRMSGSRALRTSVDLIIEGTDDPSPLYTAVGRHLHSTDAIATPFHVEFEHEDDGDEAVAKTFCRCRFHDSKGAARSRPNALSPTARRLLELLQQRPTGMAVRSIREQLGQLSNRSWATARDQLVAMGAIECQAEGKAQVWRVAGTPLATGGNQRG